MTSTAPVSLTAPISPTQTPAPTQARSGWPGVIALMVAIFTLVTSEFLPASLLPLMADDFGITEGTAGQVVTATALLGMIAGPGIGLLFPRLDRRRLLIGLLVLALLSNLLTALAPSYALVVVARLVLGAAIAGTWAMALAVASHLVWVSVTKSVCLTQVVRAGRSLHASRRVPGMIMSRRTRPATGVIWQ